MALNIDDIKEQTVGRLRAGWEQVQESSLYQQARDKYENLTPTTQKLVLVGAVGLVIFALLAIPGGSLSTSSDSITRFEEKRSLIRDLLKVSRDANDSPDIPTPPDISSLKSRVEMSLQQAQLLPEQMKGVEITSESSTLVPAPMVAGMLKVSLAQLNLRQIVDLGYQIQAISPSFKMTAMEMIASAAKPKYFDVVFKFIALNVPQPAAAPSPDMDDSLKGGRKAKPPRAKTDKSFDDSNDAGTGTGTGTMENN